MSSRNLGAAYGAQLDRVNRAEAKLRRAFHAWEKERAALIRRERQLDQAMRSDEGRAPS